jgi:hypothetical protein
VPIRTTGNRCFKRSTHGQIEGTCLSVANSPQARKGNSGYRTVTQRGSSQLATAAADGDGDKELPSGVLPHGSGALALPDGLRVGRR